MRIAVLVKQVPRFEAMSLSPDGRLRREGLELEMNPYCRRAVAKGVELARASDSGSCTVLTLGPPTAEDVLREAVAWGADQGVLVTDPAFAGSDTLATSRALAAALQHIGPFDLVLTGRNSVDADTGQVGPEIAELLDLPFLCGVKELTIEGGRIQARCEYDDGIVVAITSVPAVLACAERLCEPAKVSPEGRAAVDGSLITRLTASELGPGPWGQTGSPTSVGRVESLANDRARQLLSGPVAEQVRAAEALMRDRGALSDQHPAGSQPTVPGPGALDGPMIAVLVEPGGADVAAELLGAGAALAERVGGHVLAAAFTGAEGSGCEPGPAQLSSWGADSAVMFTGAEGEDDGAAALSPWVREKRPWALLAPGTVWGREVVARVAARLNLGLTGDAVDLTIEDGRLIAWKPAFGGSVVAAVTTESEVQMVTVRPGVLPLPGPRAADPGITIDVIPVDRRGRVRRLEVIREDELATLARADVVVGVGGAVKPDEYAQLKPLLDALGAELGASRKVTDKAWLPRARQIGITGRSIGPRLYIAVGISGKFNHMVGVRSAGFILAVNIDPNAPVFEAADAGIVGDWHEVVPLLVRSLAVDGPA